MASAEEESSEDLDRLGSASLMDNLGIMLFFLVLLVVAVVAVVALAVVLRKNKKAQELF